MKNNEVLIMEKKKKICFFDDDYYLKRIESRLKKLEDAKNAFKEESNASNYAIVASCYTEVGDAYKEFRQYSMALEYYLEALHMMSSLYGDTLEGSLIDLYESIGIAFTYVGKYREGVNYGIEALKKREEICKSESTDSNYSLLANSYYNAGTIMYNVCRYERAFEYYQKAFETKIIIHEMNPENLNFASDYVKIGLAGCQMGLGKVAVEYAEKALKMKKRIYEDMPNHPEIADCYNSLGIVYNLRGENERALECFFAALDIRKTIYVNTRFHVDLMESYENVSKTYKQAKNEKKRLEYFFKSLEMKEGIYAEDPKQSHTNASNYFTECILVREHSFDYSDLLEIMEQAYNNEPSDKNYSHLATICYFLGRDYSGIGDYQKAIEMYEKALEIRENLFKKQDNSINCALLGLVYSELSDLYSNVNYIYRSHEVDVSDFEKAIYYSNKAIFTYGKINVNERYSKAITREKEYIVSAYLSMSYCYEKQGDLKKAQEYEQQAQILKKEIKVIAHLNYPPYDEY